MDLVGAGQRIVQPARQVGHRVGRVKALVGIHLARIIGVGGHLPAADIDGLQSGFHHLHRLVAGHRAQGVDVGAAVQHLPQALGADAGKRVFDAEACRANAVHLPGYKDVGFPSSEGRSSRTLQAEMRIRAPPFVISYSVRAF